MKTQRFSRREILKMSFYSVFSAGFGGLGGFKYSTVIEPDWLDVVEVRLTLPRLPIEFDGYKIVHVSDFHVDDWMNQGRLAKVIDVINAQTPDVIALTGDFVNHNPDSNKGMMKAEFSRLQAKDETYAVLGNHDHWTNPHLVRKILKQSGITVLKNDLEKINRNESSLYFGGLDDVMEKQQDLPSVLQKMPQDTNTCAIMLCHEPDFVEDTAESGRFDLQLSGHSHGGQVRVPFIGPLVLPKHGETYTDGLYQVKNMWQYTTRGVGMVHPRVRFNCRPEVTVITLFSET